MSKKISILSVMRAACAVMVVAAAIFLICDIVTKDRESKVPHSCDSFNEWNMSVEGGVTQKVTFPCDPDVEIGEGVTFSTVLPDRIEDDTWIVIFNACDMKISIDGELRKKFSRSECDVPGGMVKSIYCFCRLYKEDAGKEISIYRYTSDKNNGLMPPVYLGDRLGIVYSCLKNWVFVYVGVILLLTISVVLILVCFVLRISAGYELKLFHLAVGIMLSSFWQLFDSNAFQFVFETYYIDGTMAYFSTLLMPFPFVCYINAVQGGRYKKLHNASGTLIIFNALIPSILHFTGVCRYEKMLVVIDSVIAVALVMTLVTILLDLRGRKLWSYGLTGIGILGFLILCGIELIALNNIEFRTDGIFFMLALYFLLAMSAAGRIRELIMNAREKDREVAANITKTNFLVGMSHEIRTPINSILGMNEMILRECDSAQIKDYANQISSSGRHLLHLINDMFDVSRLETEHDNEVCECFEMVPLMEELVMFIHECTEPQGLTVELDIDASMPMKVLGDERRIKQIAIGMFSCAAKYSQTGKMKVIAFCVEKNQETLLIDSDSKQDKRELVFGVENAGFAPDAVDKISKDLNREVFAENTSTHGNIICVRIPIIVGWPEPIRMDSWSHSSNAYNVNDKSENRELDKRCEKALFSAPDCNVLAVDDNDSNLAIIRALLKRTRVKVDTTNNGTEAVKMCTGKKYDIILMDHMMPEPDGIATMHRIKSEASSLNADTPVVVLTANAVSGMRDYYLSEGFEDYLTKPLNPEMLESDIKRLIAPEKVLPPVEQAKAGEGMSTATEKAVTGKASLPADKSAAWGKASLPADKSAALRKASSTANLQAEGSRVNCMLDSEILSDSEIAAISQRLQMISEISFDKTVERFFDDKIAAIRIFSVIDSEGETKLAMLKKAYTEHNYDAYRIEAHAIKGVMATIYANHLSERAKENEYAVRENRFEFVTEDGPGFAEEYELVLDKIHNALYQ